MVLGGLMLDEPMQYKKYVFDFCPRFLARGS